MIKSPTHPSRRWIWIIGLVAAGMLIVTALSYFFKSESLRKHMENQMNRHLKEYTVHVGRVYFHPFTFSVDLRDLILVQNANREPPVASIRGVTASVHWRELLRARLVGDFLIDRPKLYINLKHVRKEVQSKVPFKEKGWQEALESIYPLKINLFRIQNGELTYVDEGPYEPLQASEIYLKASNIRNIQTPERVYPSSVHLEAKIFNKGMLTLNGQANFLQEPHLGIKGDLDLVDMDLSYFKPIIQRENVSIRKGILSAKGNLEYAPNITEVNLKYIGIKAMDLDYLHLPQTVAAEQKRVQKAAHTAKELSNKPSSKIRIEILQIENSKFGYENKTTTPNYRLYIDQAAVTLKKFSNQFVEGPATLDMKGRFMGTGDTHVFGTFRPETKSPDFNVNVAIKDADMRPMSDLFRAYGNFDIEAGSFSFYSELKIKDDTVNGYVKPLFKDMKVYDRRSYQEKSVFHKLYVGLVGTLSKLLENRTRKEVATKTNISGPLESPGTNTWEVIVNLIRNAFIQAILPGFEREVTQSGGPSPPIKKTKP